MEKIICTLKKEGFMAHYYPGNIETDKAIISVGGAYCNEKTSIAMSGFLRKAGYNVLVLGFYLWKGLSKNLASVPVDYVEKAVKWLKEEQGIKQIAMTGASTGAGYTLLCASLIPDITCVIPVVPYDYVMEGTTSNYKRLHCSVYTWHGKNIPYTEISLLDRGILNWLRMAKNAPGYGLRRSMRFGYDYTADSLNQESRIKVENMHADILFLSVQDDDCWPSDVAVLHMTKVLEESNYSYRVKSHIYEKGSHVLVDGLDAINGVTKIALKSMIPAEKKYPIECEEARQDSFKRILEFIKEW